MATNAQGRLVIETDREEFIRTGKLTLAAVEGSGEYRTVLDSEELDVSQLPEGIQRQLEYSGVSGVIGQRTSEIKGAREKLDYLRERELVQWPQGNWAAKRSSAGGGPVPLWIRAVARVYNSTESEAAKSVQKYTEDQKEKIKNHPSIVEAIQKIKEESQEAEAPDLSDLLEE